MKILSLSVLSTALLLALLTLSAPAALAAGGSSAPPPPAEGADSPEEMANELYNEGLAARDKAWELERQAKTLPEGKRGQLETQAQELFAKAAEKFEAAVDKNPDMHQAFSSLGYALRRQGKHAQALKAYNKALDIEPTYAEAIEYRGQAYLGLNRLEDAKEAYMTLFKSDREKADELFQAMEAWVEERKMDPQGADPADVKAFAEWMERRAEVASQTAQLAGGGRVW